MKLINSHNELGRCMICTENCEKNSSKTKVSSTHRPISLTNIRSLLERVQNTAGFLLWLHKIATSPVEVQDSEPFVAMPRKVTCQLSLSVKDGLLFEFRPLSIPCVPPFSKAKFA